MARMVTLAERQGEHMGFLDKVALQVVAKAMDVARTGGTVSGVADSLSHESEQEWELAVAPVLLWQIATKLGELTGQTATEVLAELARELQPEIDTE